MKRDLANKTGTTYAKIQIAYIVPVLTLIMFDLFGAVKNSQPSDF